MKPGSVPTARVGPIIGELVAERWPHGGGYEVLGEKVGCDGSTIEGIVRQEREGVGFDLADKLLCALNRVDLWQGQLLDVWESLVFVETCALHSCGRTFPEKKVGGYVKRYCSPRCATLAARVREGNATGERLRQRGKCLKGHKMTPENTAPRKRGDETVGGQCRTCLRAYQREWARKRREGDPEFVEKKRAAQRRWREQVTA